MKTNSSASKQLEGVSIPSRTKSEIFRLIPELLGKFEKLPKKVVDTQHILKTSWKFWFPEELPTTPSGTSPKVLRANCNEELRQMACNSLENFREKYMMTRKKSQELQKSCRAGGFQARVSRPQRTLPRTSKKSFTNFRESFQQLQRYISRASGKSFATFEVRVSETSGNRSENTRELLGRVPKT